MNRRVSALFLALLLSLLSFLAACSNSQVNTDSGETPGQSANTPSTTEQPEEEAEPTATATVKERYADTNLGGYVYKVLAIPTDGHFYTQVASGINEVYSEELNGEIINDAIFNRTLLTEDTLNVKIEPVWGSSVDSIRSQLHNEVLAGSTEYD